MDIRKALLAEHSKRQTLRITAYVGADSKRFAKLMLLFLGKEYRVIQRAAWAVSWCTQYHPALIVPWLGKMVRKLQEPGVHDAVKRNTLRALCGISIPARYQGQLVETCIAFTRSKREPIAVKVFAMTLLVNICRAQPALVPEVRLVIGDMLPTGGPAIRARGKKLLGELEKK